MHGALPACEDNVKPVQSSEVGSVPPDRHKQQQINTLSSEVNCYYNILCLMLLNFKIFLPHFRKEWSHRHM